MDIATVLGSLISFGLVLSAMLTSGSLLIFVDVPSLLIVLGGTVGCCLTNYPLKQMIRIIGVIKKTLPYKIVSPIETITIFVEYGTKARKEGLLALEGIIKNTDDVFVKKGLQLLVDGMEADGIQEILDMEIATLEKRHQVGVDLLNAFATFAPAMGMIGTVIGLVQMLQNMSDPSSIGPAMAVALLTTFYGAVLANLVFTPLAGKLKVRDQEETMMREMQSAAIVSIAKGENPRIMQEKLSSFLALRERKNEE